MARYGHQGIVIVDVDYTYFVGSDATVVDQKSHNVAFRNLFFFACLEEKRAIFVFDRLSAGGGWGFHFPVDGDERRKRFILMGEHIHIAGVIDACRSAISMNKCFFR